MARRTNNLNLADMTADNTTAEQPKGVAVDAAQPYDSTARIAQILKYPTTKQGLAKIVRTDYK